jgi:hypothetical protein
MNAHTAAALQVYKRRNKVLAGLGFVAPKGSGLSNYDVYLASPLWDAIRKWKLQVEDWRCFACGQEASQVHHGDYEERTIRGPELVLTLEGKTIDCTPKLFFHLWDLWLQSVELYAVCELDHKWAEYFEFMGEKLKLPPATATKRLKNRRRKNRLDEAVPRAARQGRQERKAREMEGELNRLLRRDE